MMGVEHAAAAVGQMEALYDYTAAKDDELSFHAGAILTILTDKPVHVSHPRVHMTRLIARAGCALLTDCRLRAAGFAARQPMAALDCSQATTSRPCSLLR